MEIPILVGGRTAGRLEIRREGAYTRFDGRCEDTGEVLRLAVYGGGREGVLGVMMPEKGALALHKRLSSAAMRGFPSEMEYAAPVGAPAAAAPGRPGEESASPRERAAAAPRETAAAATKKRPRGGAEPPAAAAPPGGDTAEQGADLLWYAAGDGSLYTLWQGKRYRAVPMAAHGLPESRIVERRRIEGVEYAVFEIPERR